MLIYLFVYPLQFTIEATFSTTHNYRISHRIYTIYNISACASVCVCVSLFKKASQMGDSVLSLGGVKTFITNQEVVDFRCDQHITRNSNRTVTIAVCIYFCCIV